MEFRYLVSFLALAEELHFGRAAAKLHLTQLSLSQQLQRLERGLGVTLVARSSHEVRLTPAGEVLRDHARIIVAQLERAERATPRAPCHSSNSYRTASARRKAFPARTRVT
ncbi:LysR family transcriptional regulator [Saccharopolyspora shandongensis]|uniref:LysR family transcriptional regulator n=1 Tax=Saccharopolyspora shandongensis TaxID=418495 RepID=UPI003F4CBE5A